MLVMVTAASAPAHQRVTEPLAPNHRCAVGRGVANSQARDDRL